MARLISGTLLIFLPVFLLAQPAANTSAEDSIMILFRELYHQDTDQAKKRVNSDILNYFSQVLTDAGSSHLSFDSLSMIGKLSAPDGSFRLFTWNIPMEGFTHEYHGLLQKINKGQKDCQVYQLSSGSPLGDDIQNSALDHKNWPGALYYGIHRTKHAGEVLYTLLGFHFNDRFSDKKIIEALYFDDEGNPVFGKPVFKTEEGIRHRVIFEYSGEVVFNLRYNQDMKMIIFDHLAPIEPELAGHFRFYAPDFSYDGYRFRRGAWEYHAELDVRNR